MPSLARPVGAVGEVGPHVAEDPHARDSPRPGGEQPLRQHQQRVEREGEHHAEQRRGEELGAEVGEHAVLDEVAEAAVGHQRADRRQRDRRDGGDPQAGHHDRQRQRQLDLEQQLAAAVAEARRRLAYVVGHRAQALEQAAHQDRQRVEREADHDGRRGQAR